MAGFDGGGVENFGVGVAAEVGGRGGGKEFSPLAAPSPRASWMDGNDCCCFGGREEEEEEETAEVGGVARCCARLFSIVRCVSVAEKYPDDDDEELLLL